MTIKLKGITWNHTRGFLPMVATAQRFSEKHPDVEIIWEKRSLQEFADFPLQSLVDKYDLLVIDHPWAGYAASQRVLIPLEQHLPAEYLDDQASHSVGVSHASYEFGGYQTALAIDAATPVASYREDLLQRENIACPTTWDSLMELAKKGKVAIPAIPVDSLMNFYMFCVTLGEEPFLNQEKVVCRDTGIAALEHLRELASLCTSEIFRWNPIAVYEAMTERDDLFYCPFAYGYSNYSRPGYAKRLLTFTDLVSLGDKGPLRSTLGGTGLAISASCRHLKETVDYARFVAEPQTQRTLFVESGGQPGHRGAWLDDEVNRRSSNYFKQTLPALDRAYLRPRYDGYLHFQDHAGDPVQTYMRDGGNADQVLEKLNELYRESLKGTKR